MASLSNPQPKTTSPPRHRSRPYREDVRRAILDAAAIVFAERGIDGASLDDVAGAAGFTKGAVYSNFAGKDDLVLALMDDRVSAHIDMGVQVVRDGRGLPAQRVQVLGDSLTKALMAQRQWHLLFIEFWQRALRNPDLATRFAARRGALRQALAAAVNDQIAALGFTPAVSADELATIILALSNGLAIEAYPEPNAVPSELFGKVLQQLLVPANTQVPSCS